MAGAARFGLVALFALVCLPSVALADPGDAPPAWQSLPPAAGSGVEHPDEAEADEPGEESAAPLNPFKVVPPASVEGSLSRVLSGPDVSFCKAEQATGRHDPLLCSLSHLSSRQRCPGLRQACSNQPVEVGPSSSSGSLQSKLAQLGNLTFWLVLAGLVVAVGLALKRVFADAEFAPADPRKRTSPSPAEAALVARHVVETDVARLWALAEESALGARFEEAVAALQGALIHALRLSGKLHVSPAQTNGDYLRALRPEPSLHGPAREVFRAVEAVQFGGAPASRELYRQLLERVQPIVARVLSLLLLCAFGFGQSGCSKSLAGDPEASGHGLGVLTQLLREQHTTVRRRIRALNVIEPEVSAILVVGEQPSEAWAKLLEFAAGGGMLVVSQSSEELAKATSVHYSADSYTGRLQVPPGFESNQLELSAVARHALEFGTGAVAHERTFALAEKKAYVAERSYGAGNVLYFGDDEFLANASLSVGDNAFFVVSLLRRNGQVLELVGPWTGGGSSSTFASLFKAGLGTLLAQLALLAVLFGWHGGTAFGLRKDPIAVRRRAFRDHVLALGENYRRARATRFALASYGSWLIERLRDRLSPQQPIGLIDLAGRMAGRVEQPESELVLLLSEARDAQDDFATARSSPADLSTLEKLETLTVRAGGSK